MHRAHSGADYLALRELTPCPLDVIVERPARLRHPAHLSTRPRDELPEKVEYELDAISLLSSSAASSQQSGRALEIYPSDRPWPQKIKPAAGAALPRRFSLIRLEPRGDRGDVPRQINQAEHGLMCLPAIRAAVCRGL